MMTEDAESGRERRTAEQRAQAVVHRILLQAEAIPAQQGGGHKLDAVTLYTEVLGALRETIDDMVLGSPATG
ncbi:hypothetical protein [Roseibium sp.]|uniref:hypothetical protein n=1 Tax=Roseibium sp. TaxID=1936156 RepID=UPI003A9790D0